MNAAQYAANFKISKRAEIRYSTIIGNRLEYKRSNISVKEAKQFVNVHINASDITALIASSNYVLKAVKTAEAALTAKIPQKNRKV
ncbi:MAG: hypothetical protein QXN59_01790 [Candidatus Micrarchaeaceae archaeon]